MKNFPRPFHSPRMLKYNKKTLFTHITQSIVQCKNFSKVAKCMLTLAVFRNQMNLFTYGLDIKTVCEKVYNFQGLLPKLSRTVSFNFQDFPSPEIFKKKSKTFQELWKPCTNVLSTSSKHVVPVHHNYAPICLELHNPNLHFNLKNSALSYYNARKVCLSVSPSSAFPVARSWTPTTMFESLGLGYVPLPHLPLRAA